MDKISIRGGQPLHGRIPIAGAKNAALKLMTASLLTEEELRLSNIPHLADTSLMVKILADLGAEVHMNGAVGEGGCDGSVMSLTAKNITKTVADYDLVRKMRASFLVLGPLLARFGEATVSLPGGCAIGTRPVDLHLKAMELMGAEIDLADGYVQARAPKGLRGAEIDFPMVSVGATENAIMAATLANGTTVIRNAACEPEVTDLVDCLIAMGGRIEGGGTPTLKITGQSSLRGATHTVLADRIETGTYAMAVAATGGEVDLIGGRRDLLDAAIDVLEQTGTKVMETNEGLRVSRNGSRPKSVDVETQPFPGFPTDLQAQFMALMATAEGTSEIKETIFENRFMHVPELMRMGADISVSGEVATVRGIEKLRGAPVMATDLRASVSLVVAGLAAEDETIVNRVYHLDRGFERLEEKLTACGAQISRIRE